VVENNKALVKKRTQQHFSNSPASLVFSKYFSSMGLNEIGFERLAQMYF
jgi:hypothetical protein